jgi:hypothetical protein
MIVFTLLCIFFNEILIILMILCLSQFHCYKKCPTTRAGGMNFGICTPPDAVKMTINHVQYPFMRTDAPHVISCRHDDENHQSSISAAKSEEHSKFSICKNNNMTTNGGNLYVYDSNNGASMTDHGSTDDIERYFTSADGWDKTESPRSARLCSEEESSGPREYYYDSASDKNRIIYIDSTTKDMYPFLTTPTPQKPRSVLSPPTGTLLVGRTSSLPMPCTQDGHSRSARMSNSTPASAPNVVNNNRSAVAPSKVSIDFAMKCKEPLMSAVGPGPDVYGSYLGRSEIDQRRGRCDAIKKHQLRSNESSTRSSDVTNSEPLQSLMSSRSASVARRGCRGRPLKSSYCDLVADMPPSLLPDYTDIRTATGKSKPKKSRVTPGDSLLLSHGAGSIKGKLPGLLEGFLSSNYFIKDDLNDMTGPFFMQTSFQCYPKVPSIGELLAKSTSVSVGLAPGGKKRYRKHQASVSAKKLKIQQCAENNKVWSVAVRKKALGSQTLRESAMKTMVVDPDNDDRMAGVYCEGA